MKPQQDPLIGLSILKEFSDVGYFSGVVVEVIKKKVPKYADDEPSYKLRYTDGDEEVATRSEVIQILMPKTPCVFASVKLSGESSRIVPRYFLQNRTHLVLWGKVKKECIIEFFCMVYIYIIYSIDLSFLEMFSLDRFFACYGCGVGVRVL
jgi:hypothetical protein